MKKNHSSKLSLHLETLRHLDLGANLKRVHGGTVASGVFTCLACESLECPTHHICTVLNTCNCS